MGIDPGLGTTGWGIIQGENGRVKYISSGKIRTSADKPTGQRLVRLYRELQEAARRYNVHRCVVESGYVGRSPQSALKLGQARAAAVLAMENLEIPVLDAAPREIKMAVTGRGSAAKEQVSYIVGQMLGLTFSSGEEDISDALAAALFLLLRQERRQIAAGIK